MAKIQSLEISINGKINPSVMKMISDMEAKLKALGVSTRTQSAVMSRFYSQIFDGASRATKKTEELNAAMKRVHEIAAGVFSGEVLFKGLEKATELVERMGEGMMEFAKSSLEVRATREVLQNQQKAMLQSQGKAGLGPGIDTLLRNMEGRETMIRYDQLMATTNLLMASAPQKFQSVDDVHKMLGQLSDVSKSPATFDLASQAFTRILAEGKVDQRHLNEMSIDTGFAFKTAMATALKVTPEELTEMIAKHKLSGAASIDALMKAFDIITGPGGAAYKHAEAQLKGLTGIWARFLGHWADFEESFGKQLENFISPIAEKIFALLTPAELTHAFDQFEDMTVAFGETIANLVGGIASYMEVVGGPEMFRHLQGFGDAFGQILKHVTGGFDPDTMFSQVDIPNQGRVSVMNATGDAWVKQFTAGIDSALDKMREFQTRLDQVMTRLEPIIGLLRAIGAMFQWIDDILFGKILPFFFDKLMEDIYRLQNQLHVMLPWLVPAVGTGNSGQNALYQNYRDAIPNAERLNQFGPGHQGEPLHPFFQKNTDALKDSTDASEKLRQAIESATGGLFPSGGGAGSLGGNAGLHGGLSDQPGETFYEHPDTEGHSSQYGPEGNKLGYGYGVGLGPADRVGHPLGSWVKIRTPNGRTLWRQVNEHATRGIEFVTPHTDESSYGSGKSQIIDSSATKPPGVTMNFHIHAIDSDSFAQTIHKHAEVIAEHVQRVTDSYWQRTAPV